jgi:transglutaminase-like putative cysteine protease
MSQFVQPESGQPESGQPESGQPEAPRGGRRYRVRHASAYRYGSPIVLAHHLLHLTPRAAPNQIVLSFQMGIDPAPSVKAEHFDYFGNPTTYIELHEPHPRLTVVTDIEIDVAPPVAQESDIPWENIPDALADAAAPGARTANAFAFASPMIGIDAALRDFALDCFTPGRGLREAALDLTNRIYNEFTFDSTATTISTPISEVFANRRGVCQDFAHLQIGCLRALGLAARYVSGYLRTIPPPGRPKVQGADASHAWLSVWGGGDDWLDFDPTNGRAGSSDLITLAWGRDYGDVSPLHGIILGSNSQNLTVEVDVIDIDD